MFVHIDDSVTVAGLGEERVAATFDLRHLSARLILEGPETEGEDPTYRIDVYESNSLVHSGGSDWLTEEEWYAVIHSKEIWWSGVVSIPTSNGHAYFSGGVTPESAKSVVAISADDVVSSVEPASISRVFLIGALTPPEARLGVAQVDKPRFEDVDASMWFPPGQV